MDEMAEYVRAGAAFLDKTTGYVGWRDKIDLITLDLRNDEACILGQVFGEGGYWKAMRDLNLTMQEALDFGFTARKSEDFDPLTQAWRKYLSTAAPEPELDMDEFIDTWATELERIYEAQTAGSFTFHGVIYKMMKDLESKGVHLS